MLTQDVRKLLPIGSVVRLVGAQKYLMIFGIRQTDTKENREYDYIAVMYPEGNLGENLRFMFDHDAIEEILFTGYESVQRQALLDKLHTYFESQNQQKRNNNPDNVK
ncbi:MAG: DUF4176 domain-containing protein [Clostridiales bacterium]|nr:DUF4176 domain-containing protein [Clostridiales bacterium]